MHDDAGVGAHAVQLGVQKDRGRDVPMTFGDLAVGVEANDVGGSHLLPPHAPGVAPHAAVVRRHGDVARQIFPPALARQDAERARELLADRQIVTDARAGSGQTHAHDGIRETLRP